MSVQEREIFFYGCATMPNNDTDVNIGGAIATFRKVCFSPLSASGSLAVVSAAAGDVGGTINVWGRDTSGVVVTASIALNGTTAVPYTTTAFERILKTTKTSSQTGTIALYSVATVHAGTSTAADTYTITLASGASATDDYYLADLVKVDADARVAEIVKYIGSTKVAYIRGGWTGSAPAANAVSIHKGVLFDKNPYEITEARRVFYDAAANAVTGSAATFYEKVFVYNQNTTKALTNAQLAEVSEGLYANIAFAVAATLDGTDTNGATYTRLEVGDWTGRTFNSTTKDLGAAGGGDLTPLHSQEVFIELALPAGTAAANSFYKLKTTGQST